MIVIELYTGDTVEVAYQRIQSAKKKAEYEGKDDVVCASFNDVLLYSYMTLEECHETLREAFTEKV